MSVIIRDLIEYKGLNLSLPVGVEDICEIQIDDKIVIPKEKPEIEQISSVTIVSISVKNAIIVKSALNKYLNTSETNAFKYIAEAVISWRIEYISSDIYGNIYTLNGESSTTAFIPLPATYKFGFNITPSVLINDINVFLPNKKSIFMHISGTLIIEQC